MVLVTPYTLLYLVNRLLLEGVLDRIHYVFFELIFVIAFRRVFGIPDLAERLFPAREPAQAIEANPAAKTPTTTTSSSVDVAGANKEATTTKKKSKKTSRKPKVVKEHIYAREMAAMEKTFFDYVNDNAIWELVHEEQSSSLTIQVHQYKARPMCYKIISVMKGTPATTFDLLCDVAKRTEWDPLCVEAKSLASISPGVKVHYVRTKGMWPTASRDTVVLGFVKDLGEGRLCNITSSIEHPSMPVRAKESIVRMDTAVAGQIVEPIPGDSNSCRLIQILDTDLKGWIPDKLIQMVSTKAVPEGIRKINKMLPKITPYSDSKVMETFAVELKEAETRQNDGESGDEPGSGQSGEHELKKHREDGSQSELGHHRQGRNSVHGQGSQHEPTKSSSSLERSRPSVFRAFWEGAKQRVGGRNKLSNAVIATVVLAVLGPALARYRRQRRK
ncbi:Collagen type IV alpha-3-binding protein [Lunasporangiospora selenospora]|uniref:Collagen type IV alpha-3-binding protein n=1 Tax=Lunasporangiospora selenospora TaxID=979761 RepID=A0A9P6FUL1_9FUNG|nr:Collagen type IV alpha-3-binding protein [Lunasporangiospora selenospora]